jgi:DNA-binding transcriptional LysR family regulator
MLKRSGITIHNAAMRNLELELIRAFVAVADHRSMTVAGNALHLTQSAVSQQIMRLERRLGQVLFLRERRGLKLTAAGDRLLAKARRLIGLNDEIWAEMTTACAGPVRLGVPYDLAGPFLAPILKGFAEASPLVEISLVCATSPQLLEALGKGEVDIALVEEPVATAGGECLGVERLVWVGARAGNAHLKQPLPLSLIADSCAFRPAVTAALDMQGRAWRSVFDNGNIDVTTATVRTDLAITAWLACTVPPDLDILGVEESLPELPPFAITLHLSRSQPSEAARELARHLRAGWQRPRQAV